jgi:hypothetical protein
LLSFFRFLRDKYNFYKYGVLKGKPRVGLEDDCDKKESEGYDIKSDALKSLGFGGAKMKSTLLIDYG